MRGELLKVESLVAGYTREAPVLRGVNLVAEPGSITLIIGPNGAGKSTLLKAIYGLVPIFEGRVLVGGDDVTGWPPERLVRSGVALSPQDPAIFPDMSVRENLELAAWLAGRGWSDVERALDYVPVLRGKLGVPAGSLSGGERKLLDFVRTMIYEPRVLLLDEPTAGVAPKIADEIYSLIRRVAGEGVTVLLVDQRVREAMSIADRVVVMEEGRVVLEGERGEVEAKLREIAAAWLAF